MSLLNKTLLFPNVLDMFIIDSVSNQTMFTGNMTKNSLSQKGEKMDIFAGMDNEKIASINVRKELTLTGEIATFDLNYFAYLNGVKPDLTTKKILVLRETATVTTAAATITDATKIYAVESIDGVPFQIITTDPTADTEVKVSGGNALTFKTGSTVSSVFVTYEKPQAEGKEAVTINFNAKSFPNAVRVIAVGKIIDADTEDHVADAQLEIYRASAASEWDLSMDLGKSSPVAIKLDVLVPKVIDGVLNTEKNLGRLIIKEL